MLWPAGKGTPLAHKRHGLKFLLQTGQNGDVLTQASQMPGVARRTSLEGLLRSRGRSQCYPSAVWQKCPTFCKCFGLEQTELLGCVTRGAQPRGTLARPLAGRHAPNLLLLPLLQRAVVLAVIGLIFSMRVVHLLAYAACGRQAINN